MDVRITKGKIREAVVRIPASKSLSHRALISAALHDGISIVRNVVENQDTEATMRCLSALGASFETKDDAIIVHGISDLSGYHGEVLDCGESGSTLRFLIPLLAVSGVEAVFTGHGRLMDRPQSVYADLFAHQDLKFEKEGSFLHVCGPLKAGTYRLKGDVSSQFITGLLFALPLLEEDSVIEIEPPYESASYVALTEDALELAGVRVEDEGLTIRIPGKQSYGAIDCTIDGDDSQAAFFASLAYTAQVPVSVLGMKHDSRQGDHAIVDIIRRMGGEVFEIKNGYRFEPSQLRGTAIDLANCPDLGPMLFALATQAEGVTIFQHCGRLRIKESDRIACMNEELEKLGCTMNVDGDTVRIVGKAFIRGARLDGHNDHRLVMALSILACAGNAPVTIAGAQAINKSYPEFFEDLKNTGAEVNTRMLDTEAKISIVGLGLLGGSYAKGFNNAGYHNIYAVDIDQEAITFAKNNSLIKDGSTDPSIIEGSDVVISALYPHTFPKWVAENQKYFKPGSILTDVTGVKRNIIREINEILREDVEFIAAHPMAGREFKGIQYSDENRFHAANYIIVPTPENTPRAIQTAEDIGQILKFRHITSLTPEGHDAMIGYLSQLTHVIAVSLMNANDNTKLAEYTGDSFRDLTRIANINEDLWPELFIMNKDYLVKEIEAFVDEMVEFRDLIQNEDIAAMKAKMIQSAKRRKAFDVK